MNIYVQKEMASCTPADVLQRTLSGVNQIARVFHHLLRRRERERKER